MTSEQEGGQNKGARMKQAYSQKGLCVQCLMHLHSLLPGAYSSNIASILLTTTRGVFKWGIWKLDATYNPGQNVLGHLRK